MALDAASFIATLERLWSRSRLLLWALAAASLVAFVRLAIAARLDATTFGPAARSATSWLLPLGLGLLVLACFRSYHDIRNPPVRLVPTESQFFCHVNTQTDGRLTTQIAGHFEIYNLSDQPIVLTDVRVVRPRT